MGKEIHDSILKKLKKLPDNERKLAIKALQFSSRTNATTVADKLYNELNKIQSSKG